MSWLQVRWVIPSRTVSRVLTYFLTISVRMICLPVQVYGNNIYHVDNGAVNAIISPQQVICENTCEDGVCERTG